MKDRKLNSFIAEISASLADSRAKVLWEMISRVEDIFDHRPMVKVEQIPSIEGLPLLKFGNNLEPYIPIEDFKDPIFRSFQGEIAKTFMSSGTTDQSRSQSSYSNDGLLLYQGASVIGFYQVLKHYHPDPWAFQGFSLIPRDSEWPSSSLAQMLRWISNLWSVHYMSEEDFHQLKDNICIENPFWIFGTAFHYINLMDRLAPLSLPQRALIIETGGTKGKTRNVSRHEFYNELCQFFAIPPSHIISEYGMCELASQAWDFGHNQPSSRRFRFPFWVKSWVSLGGGRALNSGMGSLLVDDPLRLDYGYPIRTQDLVQLVEDGSFRFLGRSHKAPLKGCSINAEDLLANKAQNHLRKPSSEPMTAVNISSSGSMPSNARIESFAAFLKSTFSQQDILNALKEEIGSLSLAKLSMQGLIDDLPKDAFAWQKAITQSHVLKGPRDWLFILPQNHGIAGFYPISLAFLCQRNLSVRIPKNFDKEHSSLKLFLNALAKWDNKHRITMLNDLFKLGSNIFVGEQSGIFLFGSDETIDLIRSLTSSPLVAYGTTLGIAIISDSPSINTLQHLSRDYLSLGQRGCRSTRIAFVISEDPASDLSTLATMLQQVSRQQRPDPLSLQAKAALDYEDLGFQRKGNRRPPRTSDDDFLIPILGFDKSTPINHWLGGAELTLPLIVTPDIESIFAYIRSINAHIILTVDSFLLNQISPQISDTFNEICPLGNAQSVPWDGTYQGQPLFQALSLP